MNRAEFISALETIEQQYLADSSSDGTAANRFLDLRNLLLNHPEQFWDAYFSQPITPEFRAWFERMMAKHGPDMTFGDLKRELQEANSMKGENGQ